ncbi:hypothetical protein ACFYVR_25920 [Rhodococcus sp. NPDC003318]|uniref:hypothetical protein n=1 Tax=Rhodococcus sp. NPDC003318 TaxID=3364503 RepID=UPI00367DE27C
MTPDTGTSKDLGDIRELFGMRTTAARALVTAYLGTLAYVAWYACPAGAGAAMSVAYALVSACTALMLLAPGDPLPLRHTMFTAAACAVAVNLMLAVTPAPFHGYLRLWPLPATAALLSFLCARGRTAWAWTAMAAVVTSCAAWAVGTGQGVAHAVTICLPGLAPLLMATFFAATIRPAVHQIFALRTNATLRVAAEAADAAVGEERDRQLARLDELARPMLDRIAARLPLAGPELTTCVLLEAHLRDTLRAPALAGPAITEAARRARTLGVEVILLDDHGLDDADERVRDRVLAGIATIVGGIDTGRVTVRILPPHRPLVATVLHADDDRTVRFEFDPDGRSVTDDRPAQVR